MHEKKQAWEPGPVHSAPACPPCVFCTPALRHVTLRSASPPCTGYGQPSPGGVPGPGEPGSAGKKRARVLHPGPGAEQSILSGLLKNRGPGLQVRFGAARLACACAGCGRGVAKRARPATPVPATFVHLPSR